jgi:hypothetical protein
MNRSLIPDLVCPYCNGKFSVACNVESTVTRLNYGILECRCFRFPVVDGVLLLSLSKGYGGAEESLQPYVPLQVAAIRYLEAGDLNGLWAWMRRHLPLVHELIKSGQESYLDFSAKIAASLESAKARYLIEQGRFECLGYPGLRAPEVLTRDMPRGRLGLGRSPIYGRVRKTWRQLHAAFAWKRKQLSGFYAVRFFAPRSNALALQLGLLPMTGRLLSLCCGHGVFENIVCAYQKQPAIVSVDGQLLNLFLTRRHANPAGDYICHDVQFPLPFSDGFFDGVFSSTCLPEIPAQRSFIVESIRVTGNHGWTLFDSIWTADLGDSRIDALRYYRFCQNLFLESTQYKQLFLEQAEPSRYVSMTRCATPHAYLKPRGWDVSNGNSSEGEDPVSSVLVTSKTRFDNLVLTPNRDWLTMDKLNVSPAYDVQRKKASGISLILRSELADLGRIYVQSDFRGFRDRVDVSLADLSSTELLQELFCDGVLTLLPQEFDREYPRLRESLA